jgi:flagellar biogenesis protein FliO
MNFVLPVAAYVSGLVAAAALIVLAVWDVQRLILGN